MNCLKKIMLSVSLLLMAVSLFAQKDITVSGTVRDEKGETLVGVNVVVKNQPGFGVVTDLDGKYVIKTQSNEVLIFSFVGYDKQEVAVSGREKIDIVMKVTSEALEEVTVVGAGVQRKASVVGAITTVDVKTMKMPTANLSNALAGNVAGIIAMQQSGEPGENGSTFWIRGKSTFGANDGALVLVDGIERDFNEINAEDIESFSVLKDASATAIYGQRGANGVLLITTKKGQEGKVKINFKAEYGNQRPTRMPEYVDAVNYSQLANEARLTRNMEPLYSNEELDIIRYGLDPDLYPNVDWQDVLFKDYAMSYNANVNVSGGTRFVKYFASVDYVHEGDLFDVFDNGRDYNSGYGYDRINVRSNLDFQITKSTVFKVNVAGSNGYKKTPYNNSNYDSSADWSIAQQWAGAYNIAPDVFLPKYSDGSWGYYPNISNVTNSAENVSLGGTMTTTTTQITTDFALEQDLSFITKGLSARAMVSWDNTFVEWKRGINDLYNDAQHKWINPDTGEVSYKKSYDNNTGFDFMQGVMWNTEGGEVKNWATQRNLNYQAQLNWARSFGKHNVTLMGLFSRQENARGSVMPTYREDWAFRVTYNYADRYFIEYNGAYNGSEKFSPENRFAFFNSGAIGWMISEEPFMKFFREKKIIDMLKVRASYGEIGSDQLGPDPFDSSRRWLYMNQWAYGGHTTMDLNHTESIYTWYRESAIGNQDIQWEVVKKLNIGVDYSLFEGMLAGSLEFFRDERSNIFVYGGDRSIPSYFGGTPPSINKGKIRTNGYELELRVNKTFGNDWRVWGNFSMTHAKNKVLVKDDQAMRPAYQKAAGFGVGQYTSYIDAGYIQNYDQLYGSPAHDANDSQKLVGDYYIVDFNGDGVVDNKDQAPYGYTSQPENTFNATIGFEWKGFSAFAQFYGVTNVTRDVGLTSFGSKLNTVFDTGTWWSKNTPNADVVVPRWNSTPSYNGGTQSLYDGSYIRLKNVELAYTWNKGWIKRIGLSNLKIYVNGNNLWLWTRMPDDREANLSGAGYLGAYPTVKRYNLGIKFTL